jgi:hypothetical protein
VVAPVLRELLLGGTALARGGPAAMTPWVAPVADARQAPQTDLQAALRGS